MSRALSPREVRRLWVEGRIETVERWASELLAVMGPVRIEEPPHAALVMMQAEESVEREWFCVGEVLVTQCRVKFRGRRFWGRVVGDQPSRALALAVLAAAGEVFPEALGGFMERFRVERHFIDQQQRKLGCAIRSTQVQFETMKLT